MPTCAFRSVAWRSVALSAAVVSVVLVAPGGSVAQNKEPASVFIAPDGSPPSFRLALPAVMPIAKPMRPPHRATGSPGVTRDRSAAFATAPAAQPTPSAAGPATAPADGAGPGQGTGQAAGTAGTAGSDQALSPPSSLQAQPELSQVAPRTSAGSQTFDAFRDFAGERTPTAAARSGAIESSVVERRPGQAVQPAPAAVTQSAQPDGRASPLGAEPAPAGLAAQAPWPQATPVVETTPVTAAPIPATPTTAAPEPAAQSARATRPGSRSSSAAQSLRAARARTAGLPATPQPAPLPAQTGAASPSLREQTVGVLTAPKSLEGVDPVPLEVLRPGGPALGAGAEGVPLAQLPPDPVPQPAGQGTGSLGTGASPDEEQAVREMMRQLMKEDTVVALVDGEPVRWSDVWESAEALPQSYTADPEAVFPALLRRLIDLKLLNRVGARQGLADDAEIQRKVAAYEEQLIRETVLERYLDQTISEAELRQAYLRAIDKQAAEMEVKARHILVESPEAAREIIQALDGGADFAELARKRSYGSSAARGGDLGTFRLDRMVPSFGKAVTAVPAGQYTREPVETEFGWHVILVEARSMEPVLPFEDMRDRLRAQVSRSAVRDLLKRLRGEAQIEILPDPDRVAAVTGPGPDKLPPAPAAAGPAPVVTAPAAPEPVAPESATSQPAAPEPAALGPKAKMGLPVVPLDTPIPEE